MNRFIGSSVRLESSTRWVLLGVPMDWTSSRVPGSRFGPRAIREQSYYLEVYSPSLDGSLAEVPFFDLGDLFLPSGDVRGALELVEKVVSRQLERGRRVALLGGEHLVSYGAISAYARAFGGLSVVHFDAHCDLRSSFGGRRESHASVMRMCLEDLPEVRVFQIGVRSGPREEWDYARSHPRVLQVELDGVDGLVESLVGLPVYVSVDVDVLDPAFAPGTGTPEAGGLSSRELLGLLYKLSGLEVVGFDLVEVCPMADVNHVTSAVAAKIVRECLILWGRWDR